MNADLPLRNLLWQFYDHYIGTGALIKKANLKTPNHFRDKRPQRKWCVKENS